MTVRPGGRHPFVVLCTGEHCGRRLVQGEDAPGEALRAAVRASVGGLLVTTGCMNRCGGGDRPGPDAAIAAVAWRDGPDATTASDVLVFAGVEEQATAGRLADWICAGPGDAGALGSLPLALRSRLIA